MIAPVSSRLLAATLLLSLAGCSGSPLQPDVVRERFDFTGGDAQGWSGGFADYPSEVDVDYELVFEMRELPQEVGPGQALYLSGHNRSDDLFMFLKRRVSGLEPNTRYAVTFEVELASDAPDGCVGIGGPPGEAVYLKAGATTVEPQVVDQDGYFTLTVDKGQQSSGGADARVIGDVANGDPCELPAPYRLVTRDNRDHPLEVRTGGDGALWLLVGTDSGFEGITSLYYTRISVAFETR